MRLRLVILGWEVASIELVNDDTTEDTPDGITGGGGACFERDTNPPTLEEPYYEDRLGFH